MARPALTKAALLAELVRGPAYGAALAERLGRSRSHVYDALRALREEGLVADAGIEPGGRGAHRSGQVRRKVQLTEAGWDYVTQRGAWERVLRLAQLRSGAAPGGTTIRWGSPRLRGETAGQSPSTGPSTRS